MADKHDNYEDIEHFLSLKSKREQLFADIALSIHQSLNLSDILNQTVNEVRKFLDTDRVLIYRFEPDWSGIMVAESVLPPCSEVLGQQIKDPCFSTHHVDNYRNGRIQVVENVYTAGLNPCHLDVLVAFKVKANLVIPIIAEKDLWGLLIAQHCRDSRRWLNSDVELLRNLATQLGIAIQQTELHEEINCFNKYLELKVKERTTKLTQALEFEALVRKLTEKIRDSLDESQILQTVTEELAKVLNINHCKIDLYDNLHKTTTVVYEYSHNSPICQGITRKIDDLPSFFQQLLQKQTLQIVALTPLFSSQNNLLNRLICPIFDDQGVLGNLWLIRPPHQIFNELEIKLIQQLATECAIAIRQARLYQASQLQIKELEKLNRLKDDFLKTISHELRTPMTSIMAGTKTLEKIIEKEKDATKDNRTFNRVLNIVYQACQQQKKLVDDLLSLCYVDAQQDILNMQFINIPTFIDNLIKPFDEYTKRQQQQLIIDICPEIEVFKSDSNTLKRIITELLNNACKYTPTKETIKFSIKLNKETLKFSVSNSGVEIAPEERSMIFEKFYRIPNNDPWKYGGTGLGLALVKKLVELLEGKIEVTTKPNQTIFTVTIPH